MLTEIDSFGIIKDFSELKRGDVDLNGNVNTADARLALRFAVGLDKLTGKSRYAVFTGELWHEAAVIRMKVRYENIRFFYAQLVKCGSERLFALGSVKTRIYQQVFISRLFSLYYVRVYLPQRVVRQRHYLFIYIIRYLS